MRFLDAINQYNRAQFDTKNKTQHGYDLILRNFAIFLRNPLITQVTDIHVVEWFRLQQEFGFENNTLLVKSQAIIKFFKYWRKKQYPVMDYELIPKFQKEYKPPKVGTEEDLQKVLAQLDNSIDGVRNRAIILLLADSGMRNGELCSLNKTIDVNKYTEVEGQKVYTTIIKTEKNKSSNPFRPVFWYEETNNALKEWIAARKILEGKLNFQDKQALFVGTHNWQIGKRLTNAAVGIVLRKLSRKAGLSMSFNAHGLRHKAGNDMAANGANNSMISNILGHADLNSSKIYTDLNDKQRMIAHVRYKKQG